ncbi:MAG: ACP S-malonyltransferase [Pseudomonadota bacterium]
MSLAMVFPGQGAQTVGMGRDLAEIYPAAKAVFEEVDDALGQPLSRLIWSGDSAELTRTENAQPALMTVSIATLRAMEAEGVKVTDAAYLAGHSLGEYSALCAGGALTVGDAARLLRARGRAMQDAVPEGEGAMAAVLGLSFEAVAGVAADAAEDQVVAAANDNDPAQIVISGHRAAVERAMALAKRRGAKRSLLLPVSAPFHCALMAPAVEAMAAALDRVEIRVPAVPVVSNVTARAEAEIDRIRALLLEQITGVVRWRESVAWMAGQGADVFLELGPGKALSGMVRRVAPAVMTRPINAARDVQAWVGEMQGV